MVVFIVLNVKKHLYGYKPTGGGEVTMGNLSSKIGDGVIIESGKFKKRSGVITRVNWRDRNAGIKLEGYPSAMYFDFSEFRLC